jgi:DNA-binding GntR family transcriptional regulator
MTATQGNQRVPAQRQARITDELRAHVLDGTLPPGSRLIELQLAEQYSVSRAAIRAAIGELAKEGLVDREANRGATVRRVALDEAIQITEIRAILEGLIAARAAATATPAEREELAAIVTDMRAAVAEDRLVDYSELNGRLHQRLREISRHLVASDLIANLRNRAKHHEFRLALIPGRAAESLGQHAAIVEAVVAGDAAQAELAMRAHLDSVIAVLRRWETIGARP